MGDLSEFKTTTRLFLKSYPWRRIDPIPWTPLPKPLTECRIALVSSAGFILPDQNPFDWSIPGGDVSFREIPSNTNVTQLKDCHKSKSYDHSGVRQDPNVAFPIDRVRELVESGRIGSLNHRYLSFMGIITAPGRLIHRTAPEAAKWLADDKVDIAILIPV